MSSGTIEKANSPERGGRKTSGLKPQGQDSGVAEMGLAEQSHFLPTYPLEGLDGFLSRKLKEEVENKSKKLTSNEMEMESYKKTTEERILLLEARVKELEGKAVEASSIS